MGQKVNPNGYRFGVNRNWISRWIAKDEKLTGQWIVQDEKIRNYLVKTFPKALIDRVEIERNYNSVALFIYSAQPGVINGLVEEKKAEMMLAINKIVGRKIQVNMSVMTYENANLSARLIAREIADAIENRISFRIAQKQAVRKVMKNGALGIKTAVSGRLGGTDIARKEGYLEGVVPLATLRSDIDYALELARTTYGVIGVKVWINHGSKFGGIYAKTENKKLERNADQNNKKRSNRNGEFNKNRNDANKDFNRKNNNFRNNKQAQVASEKNFVANDQTNKGGK